MQVNTKYAPKLMTTHYAWILAMVFMLLFFICIQNVMKQYMYTLPLASAGGGGMGEYSESSTWNKMFC